MIASGTEFGHKLMKAVGAQVGVTYLSAPISTGYRDLMLMRELNVGKTELRERFSKQHQERVIGPNEREAHKFAQMVRKLEGRGLVVNPGELFVPGWSQADYMGFWEETIRSFCLEMALAPGWEYSAGARYEASLALAANLPLCDVRGRELTARELTMIDARARAKLAHEGFESGLVENYMPPIDFAGVSADPASLSEHIHAFSDIVVRHNDEALERKLGRDQG